MNSNVKYGIMRGFTLIETIILILIIAILAGIGVPSIMATVNAFSYASKFQDNAVSQSIVAMSRISYDMRRLKNDASVTTANATQFTFLDLGSSNITYNQSGTSLNRSSDSLADIQSSSLAYTYYGDDGVVIATPVVSPNNTNIRRVGANFSILAGTNTLPFRFTVRPQNLRRLNEKFK